MMILEVRVAASCRSVAPGLQKKGRSSEFFKPGAKDLHLCGPYLNKYLETPIFSFQFLLKIILSLAIHSTYFTVYKNEFEKKVLFHVIEKRTKYILFIH